MTHATIDAPAFPVLRESSAPATVSLTERPDYSLENELLTERIAALELALEDVGYRRLSGESEREFTRAGLRVITEDARVFYLKNALIKRAVEVQSAYVWAQGANIGARHPAVNETIQRFMDDDRNKDELTGHQALMGKETDLQVEGNLFFTFFVDRIYGRVRVRTIPFAEIAEEPFCNPDDRREVWFYKRVWMEETIDPASGARTSERRTAWHPDWRYQPTSGQQWKSIGPDPVRWDAPVYHVKVGGLGDMRLGVSEVYAAIDWARAYKEFLEDWAKIVKSYTRFAWNLTTKGGARGVAAAKTRLGSTLGNAGTNAETNPAPLTGSTFVTTEGNKLEPIKTAGATTKAEDARRLLLMVAAATGWPETFFGDVSVGTLATAQSLDRPTELRIRNRQTLWADVLKAILHYVLLWAVKAPRGPLASLATVERQDDGVDRIEWGLDPETEDEIDGTIEVRFPSVIERDIEKSVGAIISAATLDGKSLAGTIEPRTVARELQSVLGLQDIDEELERLFPDGGSDADDADADAPPDPADEQQRAAESAIREAADEFKRACARLQERLDAA